MNRRAVLLSIAALAACTQAIGQARRMPRIAFVANRDAAGAAPFLDRFMAGMRALGYVRDANYVLEVHYASNEQSQIAPAIDKAVASRPDALIVGGLYGARAAHKATSSIPVIVATGSDFVDAGIVQSYARPGGNITGIADLTDETSVKRLQYLKAALPGASRIAVVLNPDFPATPKMEKLLSESASRLGVSLVLVRANDRSSSIQAIDDAARARVDAILVGGDNSAVANADALIARATEHRLPVASFWPGTPEMGALFSYHADVLQNYERAAYYADRILKGARPAELPIELPRSYELVVNRKVAKQLAISLPAAFELSAHRVID